MPLQDQAAAYLQQQKKAGRTIKAAKLDPKYVRMEDEAAAISRSLRANENTIKQQARDQKTGELKNYGINSYNAMIALADRWRVLRPGSAPKAKNFSGNLSGRSHTGNDTMFQSCAKPAQAFWSQACAEFSRTHCYRECR